jgi:hypothetical protein
MFDTGIRTFLYLLCLVAVRIIQFQNEFTVNRYETSTTQLRCGLPNNRRLIIEIGRI